MDNLNYMYDTPVHEDYTEGMLLTLARDVSYTDISDAELMHPVGRLPRLAMVYGVSEYEAACALRLAVLLRDQLNGV